MCIAVDNGRKLLFLTFIVASVTLVIVSVNYFDGIDLVRIRALVFNQSSITSAPRRRIQARNPGHTSKGQEQQGMMNVNPSTLEEYKDMLNPPVSYLLNQANACAQHGVEGRLELAMLIHSAVTNFDRRKVTRRRPQGQYARNFRSKTVLLFFVGVPSASLPGASEFQARLERESEQYGDIVQLNLTDVYKDLVYKAIGVLQWAATYCANSQFTFKMDDDVYIEPEELLRSLYRTRKKHTDFAVGDRRALRTPQRGLDSKWYMSPSDYPNDTYPTFLMGATVGYPTTTFTKLYHVAVRVKTIWLDDVFVTGLCTRELGIPLFNDNLFYTTRLHRKPRKTSNFVFS